MLKHGMLECLTPRDNIVKAVHFYCKPTELPHTMKSNNQYKGKKCSEKTF